MRCDVCNAEILPNQGERIEAEYFRYLLNNGFGIHESNITMLVDTGMPRDEAITALRQQYIASTSDWLLCPRCATSAKLIISSEKEK